MAMLFGRNINVIVALGIDVIVVLNVPRVGYVTLLQNSVNALFGRNIDVIVV